MVVDGGLDRGLVDGEIHVARPALLEERLPQAGTDVPVALQGVDVVHRDAALEAAFDVLPVLGRLAVDAAQEVEVELVAARASSLRRSTSTSVVFKD